MIASIAPSPTPFTAFRPKRILPLDDGEADVALVDVRRQHVDAQLVTLVDVEGHLVLGVHDARDERRHVLDRVVRLEPGGAVADERVAGGVALVERVVAGGLEVAQSFCATPPGTPLAARPCIMGSLREAMSFLSFLLIALRRSSACAGEKPATRRAMAMYCSW